jgi:DNA-directed RNA polymerase subunit RPC12/RpoP
MNAEKPCIDCRTLIGSSVANKPHLSLQLRSGAVLVSGESPYYECESCGSKLLRELARPDPGVRWWLV